MVPLRTGIIRPSGNPFYAIAPCQEGGTRSGATRVQACNVHTATEGPPRAQSGLAQVRR